jgi:hypothetical protein
VVDAPFLTHIWRKTDHKLSGYAKKQVVHHHFEKAMVSTVLITPISTEFQIACVSDGVEKSLTKLSPIWFGEPILSSPAESAANSLVNARMNKKRQMRWSQVDAQGVLQV